MVAKRTIGCTPEEERLRVQALALVSVAYKNWDVVWARMPGYPWWPGILFLDPAAVEAAGLPLTGVAFKPPEKRDIVVTNTLGKEETRTLTDRYCLVMFLDKNNWCVANMNKEVTPFTLGYAQHSKANHRHAKTSAFKLALQRAVQLFHVSKDCTEDDLALLNAPPEEKRQRVDVLKARGPSNGHRSGGVDWDDGLEDDDDDDDALDDDDDDFEFVLPKRSTKTAPRASSRKPRKLEADTVNGVARTGRGRGATVPKRVKREAYDGHAAHGEADAGADAKAPKGRKKLAAKATPASGPKRGAGPKRAGGKAKVWLDDVQGGDGDAFAPGKRTKAQPRPLETKNKPRGRPTQAAVSSESESESESSDDGDVEFIENPNLVHSDDEGDGNDEDEDGASGSDAEDVGAPETPAYLSKTPLSKIWTTHIDEPQALASAVPGKDALATDAPAPDVAKTLVYKQDFVWDDAVFATHDASAIAKREAGATTSGSGPNGELSQTSPARERALGKRQMRSVQQSQIRQSLMIGNLDPHTMVQCEAYRPAPASTTTADTPPSRSRTASSLVPPFQVYVHPDAVFVCDLHAHLATCEIIGFLGGRWHDATKTLYIQAAFPCRSLMIDGDDGSTDVEMDPGSEIELREIIQNAELEVVGWYHSHPAFAPDPSIRDIENQTSYQQLFQRRVVAPQDTSNSKASGTDVAEPFVGLIVGTYDTKRESPVSLFRYFHTRSEKVSGGARREIYMPYELVPARRQFRSVVRAEASAAVATLAMYPSVYDALLHPRYGALRLQPSAEMATMATTTDEAVTGSESFGGVDLSAAGASVPLKLEAVGDAAVSSRKRKPRADGASAAAAASDEKPAKPVKRRRGRPRTVVGNDSSASRIDLTGDDDGDDTNDGSGGGATAPEAEAMDVAKNETQASVEVVDVEASSASAKSAVDKPLSAVVVDVDAPSAPDDVPSSGRARRPRRAATPSRVLPAVLKVDATTRTASPPLAPDTGAIIIIDEPTTTKDAASAAPCTPAPLELPSSTAAADVVVETTHTSASSSAQSSPPEDDGESTSVTPRSLGAAAPASLDDSRIGSGGGRRRGRKPMQTQRKAGQNFAFSSTTDDSVERTAVASQIAVYGAFGSASGVSVASGDKDSVVLVASSPSVSSSSLSQESNSSSSSSSASADKFVYLHFSADTPASRVAGDGAFGSNVIVLSSSDDVVIGESQSSIVSLSGDDTDATKPVDATDKDDVVPESQSPSVKVEADDVNDDDITREVSDVRAVVVEAATDAVEREAAKAEESEVSSAIVAQVSKVLNEMCNAVVKREHTLKTVSVKGDSASATVVRSGEPLETPPAASSAARVAADAADANESTSESTAAATVSAVAVKAEAQDTSSLTVKEECLALTDAAAPSEASPIEQQSSSEALARELPAKLSCGDVGAPGVDERVKHEDALMTTERDAATPVKTDAASEDAASASVDTASSTVTPDTKYTDSIKAAEAPAPVLLFGRGRAVEDIRTSLARIEPMVERMRLAQQQEQLPKSTAAAASEASATAEAPAEPDTTPASDSGAPADDLVARREAHLASLRTKYGAGIHGCAEQVITLVDYYRDFERRIDLREPWRARVSKLRKIEASLTEYVRYVNVPVQLRSDFVQDIIAYLELSWELSRPGR